VKVPKALIGCRVQRTAFDGQVRLILVRDGGRGDPVNAELVIETPFLLRGPAGVSQRLDPGAGSALASVLDLFMRTVTGVEISNTGALQIRFDDHAELSVSPHPQFESWQLFGHGVDSILIGPGGETDWTM
jgi:Family of unknown function (DUF6188)